MTSRRHAVCEPINDVEAAYQAAMGAEGLSPETIRQRTYLMRMLDVPIEDATHDDVVRMLQSRDLAPSTRAAYITRLKVVFADLRRLGLVDVDPMAQLRVPRAPRRTPRPLPPDEVRRLLAMPQDRERAWTILGLYAGLRVGEVCDLPGTALRDGLHGPILRVTGKGNLTADIPAHPKVVEVLEPFYGQRGPIWPMWPSSMDRAWNRAAESVGVHGRTFHQLRHTFATRLAQAGVPLLVVAEACRHASINTTQRYAQVADGASFAAVAGL